MKAVIRSKFIRNLKKQSFFSGQLLSCHACSIKTYSYDIETLVKCDRGYLKNIKYNSGKCECALMNESSVGFDRSGSPRRKSKYK